eukprot:jgi/Phyca11/22050/fgenesh1_pg.PHYCAscaffold_517_\
MTSLKYQEDEEDVQHRYHPFGAVVKVDIRLSSMPPKSKTTGLNSAGTRAKGSSVSHRGPLDAGRRAATLRTKSKKAGVAQDDARVRHRKAIAPSVEAPGNASPIVSDSGSEGSSRSSYSSDREVLPKSPELLFTHYFDQDCDVSTMSASKDFDCVYTALAKIMELQGSEMRVTQEIVARFEAREGFDRITQKGLRSDQVQRFIECLVSEGWRCRVEKSQYQGGPTGPAGLALAAAGPGLFFVGTLERPRIGHCIVLEITEEKACFVHEAGVKIRLGQYNYADQIRWVI